MTVKSRTRMHDECLYELHREDLLILGTMQPQSDVLGFSSRLLLGI